ncbi:MAG: S16 family serine protease [Acidimicrobiales bacterium]|jgi:PDZ domain-containing protein
MGDIQMTVPGSGGPTGRPGAWWPGLFVSLLLLVAIVVGVPVAIAVHEANAYYLFSPGTAPVITTSGKCRPDNGELALPDGTPCVRLVLPRGKAHPVKGELLMVDVEVGQAGPVDWAEWELGLLGKQSQMVPAAEYVGSTPTSELGCQDTQEMVSADQDAALAALAQLHYKVAEVPDGVQIDAVLGSTPAWQAGIKCNDIVTAVDGKPVLSSQQLVQTLAPVPPGTVVVLTDHPAGGARAKLVKVRLSSPPASVVAQGFQGKSYMGVELETRVKLELPFPVSVEAGEIGGPSAGLAFTLAIMDSVSNGKLTGGHNVAATGTIDPEGDVGQVGGVQEKTAAVEKAGAQVFFVPQAEYQDAESVAGHGLVVVPVTTLGQVLQILRQRYGGDVPGLSSPGKA